MAAYLPMSEPDYARKLPSTATVFVLAMAPIYGLGAMVVAGMFAVGLPRLDAANNPVLIHQQVSEVSYSTADRRLCWTWEFTKAMEARATRVAFSVQDRDGDVATVFPYRADTGNAFDARAPTRKQGRHKIPLCTIMPEGIESPWVVNGFIDYDSGRMFWNIRANSPPVTPAGGRVTEGGG